MSSIVSRSPPFSTSTSQSNDFFWMSIRLGTSRTLSRRAKLRRVRRASGEAKTATPRGDVGEEGARHGPFRVRARPAKIAQGYPVPRRGRIGAHGPLPAASRMWRGRGFGRLRLLADREEV